MFNPVKGFLIVAGSFIVKLFELLEPKTQSSGIISKPRSTPIKNVLFLLMFIIISMPLFFVWLSAHSDRPKKKGESAPVPS